jgi:hypothetical protein
VDLWKDPAYLALTETKDAALREWNYRDAYTRGAKVRPSDVAALGAADAKATAALHALFAYEDAFFAARGIKNPSAALDRKALWKSIDRARTAALAAGRADVRAAVGAKAAATSAARARCQAGRDRAAAARAAAAEAKAKAQGARRAALSSCGVPEGAAALSANVATARAALSRTTADVRATRAAERAARKRTSKPGPSRARERADESDDEVRANLPPEFLGLFERLKRSIKGSSRKSRTEAFLEYVEAHPDEAYADSDDATDRMIAEHEAKLRRANPAPRGLTTAQRQAYDAIEAAGPAGVVWAVTSTAANALVRKGLVTRTLIGSAPAAPPGAPRSRETHTIRGRVRMVTTARYALAARSSSANPSALVALGVLVSLRYKPPTGRAVTLRWSDRGAPIVAYVGGAGGIVLVYGARPVGSRPAPSSRAEYRRTHWGRDGKGEQLAGDMLAGKAPRIGIAESITYATRKGDDRALVNYVHAFGEGGRASFTPPTVAAATVKGRAMVRLDGGSYLVNARGIVG